METPLEERFRSNDLELLKTGQYSDAQVMVGKRVLKVHKSIVCLRSGYFRNQPFLLSLEGNYVPTKKLPFGTTERQAELLLEFIYSGRIKDIDAFTMAELVDLSMVGRIFLVDEMVKYATGNLWNSLKAKLNVVSTTSFADGTQHVCYTAKPSVSRGPFPLNFDFAVRKAYEQGNDCQKVFADFVWAARAELLDTPIMEGLYRTLPLFGNDVLTTLIKGPQTSFLKSDALLSCGRCTSYAHHQGHGPSQALQLFQPEPEST